MAQRLTIDIMISLFQRTRPQYIRTVIDQSKTKMRICFIILIFSCFISSILNGQEGNGYQAEIVKINGQEIEYLDFGGSGLPLVFMAGNSRPPETWKKFAPLFANNNRVFALGDRGLNAPEDNALSVKQRALDVIGFLDLLEIDIAILIANANPGLVLIYLAEHYPERFAGLVFLANAPEDPEYSKIGLSPSGWIDMVERANLSLQGKDPDLADGDWKEITEYVPEYINNPEFRFSVPALTFTNLRGTRGLDLLCIPMWYAKMVEQNIITIPDETSSAYFKKLAKDSIMQKKVSMEWDSLYAPAYRRSELSFKNAFEENLSVIAIDVPNTDGVALVSGYEYLNAPKLIYEHIAHFIDTIRNRIIQR